MTHLSDISQALKSDERELFSLIATNSGEILLQDIRAVEISSYSHDIYVSDKLIASINHARDDYVTLRWIVIINYDEFYRANT